MVSVLVAGFGARILLAEPIEPVADVVPEPAKPLLQDCEAVGAPPSPALLLETQLCIETPVADVNNPDVLGDALLDIIACPAGGAE